jgi:hypothetical protein
MTYSNATNILPPVGEVDNPTCWNFNLTGKSGLCYVRKYSVDGDVAVVGAAIYHGEADSQSAQAVQAEPVQAVLE